MKVTFLGTGTSQGIPIIACPCDVCHSNDVKDKRLRTSILIEINNLSLVIDSGPDFRQQMLSADVQKLDAILYTHGHKDHIAGLDDIRAFNYIQQQPVDIYAEEPVQSTIKQEFAYIFAEKNTRAFRRSKCILLMINLSIFKVFMLYPFGQCICIYRFWDSV